MIKISIAVPYEALLIEYEKCIEKNAKNKDVIFETQHIKGTKDDFIKKCDADIIIARGITSQAIKAELSNVYMVDIEVTGYDIFNALMECNKKHGATKMAIVASESILCNLESLEKITNYKISLYRTKNEAEITAALKDGLRNGVGAFIGGTTMVKICENQQIPCQGILVGNEAMETSIRLAISAAENIKNERSKTKIMKKMINNTQNGIIAMNTAGTVLEINDRARKIFDIPQEINPMQIEIKHIFEKHLLPSELLNKESYEALHKIDEKHFVVKLTPLSKDADEDGMLIKIQNIEQIRKAEIKIRSEIKKTGFFAKYTFEDILGESKEIKTSMLMAHKYSQVDSSVLIVGETGTGKELFAHSIHNASNRRNEPFVAVNCAAVPENLLESELFGYSEWAFSGAARGGKTGLFELAHKGTIFLDEIGEMPSSLQAKLLRVLQEREIRRVGDNKVISIDVRIISATNINIEEKIRLNEFRSDLYYRLNLLDIHIAPLRERRKDIPLLVKKFVSAFEEKNKQITVEITTEALDALTQLDWLGNVRELKNICQRLVVLCDGGIIGLEDISRLKLETLCVEQNKSDLYSSEGYNLSTHITKNDLANSLGISRTTLWRRTKNTNKNK